MSRSKNLRKLIANQIIDDLSQGNIESPLPSQTILADLYSVSRTTIRNIINEFIDKKLLIETNNGIVLSRKPDSNDKYKKVKKNKNKTTQRAC
ncbi:helix-turn-helix domain-containing protein [Photobacterium angustum]|uniref:GntR family transcriptional regulator n=1 Tax=Photobacterium angustum TaxID=661 RepID=UPI0005EBCEEA|nr:GntR family transcriptional regulator [Photobacterium angustum]